MIIINSRDLCFK